VTSTEGAIVTVILGQRQQQQQEEEEEEAPWTQMRVTAPASSGDADKRKLTQVLP
jgi:hypothetical protein